jgi:hypothetical protein
VYSSAGSMRRAIARDNWLRQQFDVPVSLVTVRR